MLTWLCIVLTLLVVLCSGIVNGEFVGNVTTLQTLTNVRDVIATTQGLLLGVSFYDGQVVRITNQGATTLMVASLSSPYGITIDTDTNIIYVCDTYNYCIKGITGPGSTFLLAGWCGNLGISDGQGNGALFNEPWGIEFHSSGLLYVADSNNGAIREINISSQMVTTVVKNANEPLVMRPKFLTINRDGNKLYVTDTNRILCVTLGRPNTVTVLAGNSMSTTYTNAYGINARFSDVNGIALRGDDESMLYIADHDNYRIRTMRLNDSFVGPGAGSGALGATNGPYTTATFSEGVPLGVFDVYSKKS